MSEPAPAGFDSRRFDLDGAVGRTRVTLTRRLRLRTLAEGLGAAAIGVASIAAWRAAVDPAFAWITGGALVAGVALLVSLFVAGRQRVGTDVAARVLDRAVNASDRILTARDPSKAALAPVVAAEVASILQQPPHLPRLRAGRPLALAVAGSIATAVLGAVTPPPAPAPRSRVEARATDALVDLARGTAGRLDDELTEALTAARVDSVRLDAAAVDLLDAALENAERRARIRESIDRALGDDEVGRQAHAALGSEKVPDGSAGGEGAADAIASRLERAAEHVAGERDERVAALLREIAAALRSGRSEDRGLATARLRRAIGGGTVDGRAVAEARRALKSGPLSAKGSAARRTDPPARRTGAAAAADSTQIEDPALAAVVERYFRQVDRR